MFYWYQRATKSGTIVAEIISPERLQGEYHHKQVWYRCGDGWINMGLRLGGSTVKDYELYKLLTPEEFFYEIL